MTQKCRMWLVGGSTIRCTTFTVVMTSSPTTDSDQPEHVSGAASLTVSSPLKSMGPAHRAAWTRPLARTAARTAESEPEGRSHLKNIAYAPPSSIDFFFPPSPSIFLQETNATTNKKNHFLDSCSLSLISRARILDDHLPFFPRPLQPSHRGVCAYFRPSSLPRFRHL